MYGQRNSYWNYTKWFKTMDKAAVHNPAEDTHKMQNDCYEKTN